MTGPGADERRIRSLLRRRGVGPDALPPEQPEQPARVPMSEPDWLDRLYADEQLVDEPEQPQQIPWYSLRKHDQDSQQPAGEVLEVLAAPGVQITITPAPGPTVSPWRARMRRWVLVRGTAACVGYVVGIGPAVADALADAGPGAIGVAGMFYAVAWWLASRLTRLVPAEASPEVHAAADWVAHIPDSAVLLALALNTPNALI
ncbi:hypothetical protein [Streptomyces pacificus]|uniref:Uncharacterized protein n=1 Tax=Streptomyces pacificus TaxID=2705029 RepID=A0A6A0B2D1_9ACTN|nr:hypothetical protein [Streptomyces pacificus]GFH38893.1 hypothetical protein SCWH03_51560 [Streptomyces pacificus]